MYLWDTHKRKFGKFVGTSTTKKIILTGLTFMINFIINLMDDVNYE